MTQSLSIKIVVLGAKCVGKSDWLYQQAVKTDDGITNVEILDISREWKEGNDKIDIKDQILWAEAFVLIYSICDRHSFNLAEEYLKSIAGIRAPVYVPIILLGNKRDLEVGRQVNLKEGRTLALKFGCQFFEISAADSNCEVSQAFEWLLHQTHKISRSQSESSHSSRSHHRKLSIVTVSRVFSAMFGKSHSHGDDNNNNNNNNNNNKENSNGNSNRLKNSVNNVLNSKRKNTCVTIPVVRKSTKPTISL